MIAMVRRFATYLSPFLDPLTRGWMSVLTGDVVRMLLGFGVSILVARSLGPGDFGLYAVLGAGAGIAGAVADFGLSSAAVKEIAPLWSRARARGRHRGLAFFWIRFALALLVAAAGILLAPLLVCLLGLPAELRPAPGLLLAFALLGMVATAASGVMSTLLQATGHFGRIAILLVLNTGLTLLLALALALAGRLNLVTALLVLGIAPSLVAFAAGWWLLPGTWRMRFPSRRYLQLLAGRLLRFGRWLWLGNILAVLTLQLDLLLLNRLSVATTVGVYGLALNLATKMDVVNRSLFTVLLPAAASLKDRRGYARYLRRGLLRSGLLSLLLLPASWLARPFILVFYGAEYAAAIPLFRLLLLAVAVDMFAMPFLMLAFPLQRPRWLAATEGLRALSLFLTGITLIPAIGPTGAAAARIVARVAGFLLILFMLRHHRLRR